MDYELSFSTHIPNLSLYTTHGGRDLITNPAILPVLFNVSCKHAIVFLFATIANLWSLCKSCRCCVELIDDAGADFSLWELQTSVWGSVHTSD